MEIWMKCTISTGVYTGELGLTGFVSAAVKGAWKSRVAQIEVLLGGLPASKTQNAGALGCTCAGQGDWEKGFAMYSPGRLSGAEI